MGGGVVRDPRPAALLSRRAFCAPCLSCFRGVDYTAHNRAQGVATMDLAELSQRSQLERRKLRYVLDHKLVPELHIDIKDEEHGRPRHFAEDVGFGIVCAARLQEAGLLHNSIRGFLKALLELKFKAEDPLCALAYVMRHKHAAYADWGDDKYARLRVGDWDSGWRKFGSRKPDPDVDPLLIMTLNVGRIRDQVFE